MRFMWLILVCALVISAAYAQEPDAVKDNCEKRGYTYQYDSAQQFWCFFDDGSRCDAQEYYEGRCGQEYIKPFPCVAEKEVTWDFQDCCQGLVKYQRPDQEFHRCVVSGSFFKTADRLIYGRVESIFFLGILGVGVFLGILLIVLGRHPKGPEVAARFVAGLHELLRRP